jgi:hypothetical protein
MALLYAAHKIRLSKVTQPISRWFNREKLEQIPLFGRSSGLVLSEE